MDGGRADWETTERRRWRVLFALLALTASAWSLGVPLMTGHDESGQAVRAASAVRGHLLGTPVPMWDNSLVTMKVPEAYRDASDAGACFLGRPFEKELPGLKVPAPGHRRCPELDGGGRLIPVYTNQARNPPVYPIILGVDTLVFPDQLGAYVMRLLGALICAAFLASALVTVPRLRRPRLAALAALAVLTPEAVYVTAISNTAGLEVAASFAVWMSALALALGPGAPDGRLVRRAGVALIALGVARPFSPGFAVAALVVAGVLATPERRRALIRRTDVRAWLIAALVASASTVTWVVLLQQRLPRPPTKHDTLLEAVGLVPWWLREIVGVFASTDVVPPAALHVVWGIVAVLVLVWSLRRARARDRVMSLGLAAGSIVLLVSGQGLGFPDIGVWWQGRYVLPLMMGAVLTAAAAARPRTADGVAEPAVPGRSGPWLVGLLVALQVWAYLYAARHYAVGFRGTINPLRYLFDPRWSPPYGPVVLYALLFAAALSGVAAVVWRSGVALVPPAPQAAAHPAPACAATDPVPSGR